MAKKGKRLPTPQEVLEFIQSSPTKVGKRELSRAFNLKGQDRIWLKDLLKEMAAEGLIERGHKREMRPRVTSLLSPLWRYYLNFQRKVKFF